MNDKKVTYSDIAGELRRAARMYKIFEHAAEAATRIAKFERDEKEIISRIEKYKSEEKALNAHLDSVVDKINTGKEKAFSLAVDTKELLDAAKSEAKILTQKGRTEADVIVSSAKSELSMLKQEILRAKKEKIQAVQDKSEADSKLESVLSKIKSTKDRFLKEVG